MSRIRMFRVNGYDNTTDGVEFYFKVEGEADGSLLGTLVVADEGIFYYRKHSKILTDKENANARFTPDGFISMHDSVTLFEKLTKAGLASYEEGSERRLEITKARASKRVIIEEADDRVEE
jgi:hypothetical protein